ncbi:MAG: D-alanyl-D-alanine carboxypeptidase [Oscillospiraceae bacterium]|nr:D-alanyl-D-alanine carboxypeptidase [Oscillospiraceae bacterium]
MKKILFVIFAVILLFCSMPISGYAEDISAGSYVCMSADTAQVLCSREMFLHRGMASTTKVMTALIAVESGRLYETVEIDANKISAEGTSLGLKTGDKLTLYELVKGMLLSSGNDSANAVAYFISGTLEDFAVLMNEKARSIGMYNTNFVTPSGLDADGHYSCAYDMALLARSAINNPIISEMTSLKDSYISFSNRSRLYVSNHNKLLGDVEGCFGLKTGYTKKSGRCLLSAAERNGKKIIVVTLGAPDDWNDHKKLYDLAFEEIGSLEADFNSVFSVDVVGGSEDKVECKAEFVSPVSSFFDSEITADYYVEPFVYAPVKKGDITGKIVLRADGIELQTLYITAQNDVSVYEKAPGIFSRISNSIFELLSRWKITK